MQGRSTRSSKRMPNVEGTENERFERIAQIAQQEVMAGLQQRDTSLSSSNENASSMTIVPINATVGSAQSNMRHNVYPRHLHSNEIGSIFYTYPYQYPMGIQAYPIYIPYVYRDTNIQSYSNNTIPSAEDTANADETLTEERNPGSQININELSGVRMGDNLSTEETSRREAGNSNCNEYNVIMLAESSDEAKSVTNEDKKENGSKNGEEIQSQSFQTPNEDFNTLLTFRRNDIHQRNLTKSKDNISELSFEGDGQNKIGKDKYHLNGNQLKFPGPNISGYQFNPFYGQYSQQPSFHN
ncbi:Hypothetical protein SRAE_0000069400 [Strongyloides ratti]|uniref:Uncharacterized protein n=1 Tax=Strongyloides ratti TaxID=34506 RepID=A0A090KVX7_STRRB|nr:Hypothetical protein SRAE_0000069400 [Strongyloides ratti]CEF61576.1 Hypothetical protein SRAE_0000069400 [Strongyloides ratti]